MSWWRQYSVPKSCQINWLWGLLTIVFSTRCVRITILSLCSSVCVSVWAGVRCDVIYRTRTSFDLSVYYSRYSTCTDCTSLKPNKLIQVAQLWQRDRTSSGWVTLKLNFYRASYASTVLAVIMCPSVRPSVCLSVCPCVRPSQVGAVQRQLNLGSH